MIKYAALIGLFLLLAGCGVQAAATPKPTPTPTKAQLQADYTNWYTNLQNITAPCESQVAIANKNIGSNIDNAQLFVSEDALLTACTPVQPKVVAYTVPTDLKNLNLSQGVTDLAQRYTDIIKGTTDNKTYISTPTDYQALSDSTKASNDGLAMKSQAQTVFNTAATTLGISTSLTPIAVP